MVSGWIRSQFDLWRRNTSDKHKSVENKADWPMAPTSIAKRGEWENGASQTVKTNSPISDPTSEYSQLLKKDELVSDKNLCFTVASKYPQLMSACGQTCMGSILYRIG